jgi:dihydroorotase
MLHGSPVSYDLILRGGRVVDPSQKLDAVADVAFVQGKVARIGAGLPADAKTEIRDVSGRIVTPGLIDLHTHVYWGGTSLGIDAEDFCRRSGVTTAVDTGSAGPGNFAGFRKHVIERSEVRILAYLHVSFAGIYAFSPRVMVGESEELRLMAPFDAVEVATPIATSSSESKSGSAPALRAVRAPRHSTSRSRSPRKSACR